MDEQRFILVLSMKMGVLVDELRLRHTEGGKEKGGSEESETALGLG